MDPVEREKRSYRKCDLCGGDMLETYYIEIDEWRIHPEHTIKDCLINLRERIEELERCDNVFG